MSDVRVKKTDGTWISIVGPAGPAGADGAVQVFAGNGSPAAITPTASVANYLDKDTGEVHWYYDGVWH